jgi:16S rRNA (guanine966-N2)-methyltransferase
VVEEAAKSQFAAPDGFNELERRRYDDTEFVFLQPEGPIASPLQ